ncbi:MAG: hypothetical protein MJ175_02075, partial [Clostridia bacterium]|nr:hypothetical protein [Clostridia bacterium]
ALSHRQLIHYTTSSMVCQGVFQNFFKKFCFLDSYKVHKRFTLCLPRPDDLFIISQNHLDVNGYFGKRWEKARNCVRSQGRGREPSQTPKFPCLFPVGLVGDQMQVSPISDPPWLAVAETDCSVENLFSIRRWRIVGVASLGFVYSESWGRRQKSPAAGLQGGG